MIFERSNAAFLIQERTRDSDHDALFGLSKGYWSSVGFGDLSAVTALKSPNPLERFQDDSRPLAISLFTTQN